MAFSRIGCSSDIMNKFLSRIARTDSNFAKHVESKQRLHVSRVRKYPAAPALPLPINVSEIFSNETGRFTPERSRDIAAPILIYDFARSGGQQSLKFDSVQEDVHVESYDCFGAVSLNGTMQSNVPQPFSSRGKSTHLNMPGGQWARDGKYIAEDMQNSHYRSLKNRLVNKTNVFGSTMNSNFANIWQTTFGPKHIDCVAYSTEISNKVPSEKSADEKQKLIMATKKQRFKQMMKDYGATVLVFHVSISLISLGGFYLAIANGVDLSSAVETITGGANENMAKIVATSSTFVVAYTIHKLFAPVRISITLAVLPILVRYLRRVGILKPLVDKTKIATPTKPETKSKNV